VAPDKTSTSCHHCLHKTSPIVLRGSSVLLTEDGRILWFEEKPREVKSMMIGACIYILPYGTLLRTSEYLREDGNRDEPGGFMKWLCKREVVYGYMLPGQLWDIGTIENYEQLKQEFARLVPGYSSTPETTCARESTKAQGHMDMAVEDPSKPRSERSRSSEEHVSQC
jgi:NDP-sugar pyrophosphorylase family protein